jgi:hypothetical protein
VGFLTERVCHQLALRVPNNLVIAAILAGDEVIAITLRADVYDRAAGQMLRIDDGGQFLAECRVIRSTRGRRMERCDQQRRSPGRQKVPHNSSNFEKRKSISV